MIEISVDSLSPGPLSLRLGCVVRGPENAWVRFVVADLPWHLFDYDTIQAIADGVERALRASQQEETLL